MRRPRVRARVVADTGRISAHKNVLPFLCGSMNGAEFIRRVRRYARERGLRFEENRRRGKGDHRTLLVGDRFTVLGDLRKELKTGTFHGLCRQLGIDPEAL